jgi:hypothetical protein
MMDTFQAVMIVEGDYEEEYEGQIIDAWQLLIDTAVVWTLQGSYGRTAMALIERGLCTAPDWADA